MTTLQIIALVLIGIGILVAVTFFVLFMVEINRKEKESAPFYQERRKVFFSE